MARVGVSTIIRVDVGRMGVSLGGIGVSVEGRVGILGGKEGVGDFASHPPNKRLPPTKPVPTANLVRNSPDILPIIHRG